MSKKPIWVPTIIVDTREQNPWIFRKCTKTNGSVDKALATGDYSIEGLEDIFVIERKASPSELYSNLVGNDRQRFLNELDRLEKIPYKYIFIECTINDIYEWPTTLKRMIKYKTGHSQHLPSPEYIMSQLSEIMIKRRIPVQFLGKKQNGEWESAKNFINRFMYKFYNMYMNGELEVGPDRTSAGTE